MIIFFGGEWEKWLRELAYVFNSSVHTSTGYTPYELYSGRKVRIPTDILFSPALRDKSERCSISEFKKKLSEMYKLANEAMNTRQIKALTYHDQKVWMMSLKKIPKYMFIYQETK